MRAPAQATVAMVAALASLAIASFAVLRPAFYAAAVTASDGADRAEVARLQQQVAALAGTVARLRAAGPGLAPIAPAATDGEPALAPRPDDAPTPTAPTAPTYRSFEAPYGVTVTADHGALAVHNTNPALAGKVITVTGERDDGEREVVMVVVPDVEP